MAAILPCTISKPLSRRILIDQSTLEIIFEDVIEFHNLAVNIAPSDEKQFVSKRGPVLDLSYKDGTNYKIRDVETLRKMVPGKGTAINTIKIVSLFGDLSCSIEMSTYSWRDAAHILVSGSEDKASYFAESVISKLTRDADVTVFAKRIWPFAWGIIIASAIILPLMLGRVKAPEHVFGLFALILITSMAVGIVVELFKQRWLTPVAFMWGEDGRRAKQAKAIVTTVLVTVPLGLMINLMSALVIPAQ